MSREKSLTKIKIATPATLSTHSIFRDMPVEINKQLPGGIGKDIWDLILNQLSYQEQT